MNKLIAYLILAIIFYGLFSFISVEFNPLEWHIAIRCIYAVGAVFSLKIFIDDEFD